MWLCRFVCVLLCLVFSANASAESVIQTGEFNDPDKVIVNLKDKNVKIYSDQNGDSMVGIVPQYYGCEVVQDCATKYKVVSGDVAGYVNKKDFSSGIESIKKMGSECRQIALVKAPFVHVYSGKSCKNIKTLATKGASMRVLKEYKDCVYVDANEYYEGYVKKEFVELAYEVNTAFACTDESVNKLVEKWERAEQRKAERENLGQEAVQNSISIEVGQKGTTKERDAIVEYALQFVGNPYVWGGTSLTNGCDCSGFVMGVYKHFGYSMHRCSYEQADYDGREVSLKKLRKGDLVFYMRGSRIGHVTMYIGNGYIVHARGEKYGIRTDPMMYSTPCKAISLVD